jgi:hypothetical protein
VEPPTKRARVEGGMKAPSPDPHLARTPGQLEKFLESFIKEMDDILIHPEWFNAWEGYFKEELPGGEEYERLVQRTMAGLKDRVVPQLISQWLFVLGNACKQARLKQMKVWPEFVKAYHVLIAKLILLDAYALFTHHEKEDRIFLEGLALWAGHDYWMALKIEDTLIQGNVARTLRLNQGETDSKDSDSLRRTRREKRTKNGGALKRSAQRRRKVIRCISLGEGARSKQTARMAAGTAHFKQPPAGPPPPESSRESTPESEGGVEEVEEESSEDKRIEELRATEAELAEELQLKQLWIAEREKELRLKRDQEAAEGLEDQRAVEKKLPEEVKQVAMETEEEVLKPGAEGKQTREGEEKEAETLKGERAREREGLLEGEEREAETLKGKRAGERKGPEEKRPRGEQDEEMMEEGQAQETEYQTIELVELLTRTQGKERGERQHVKIPERKPSEAERDI